MGYKRPGAGPPAGYKVRLLLSVMAAAVSMLIVSLVVGFPAGPNLPRSLALVVAVSPLVLFPVVIFFGLRHLRRRYENDRVRRE